MLVGMKNVCVHICCTKTSTKKFFMFYATTDCTL